MKSASSDRRHFLQSVAAGTASPGFVSNALAETSSSKAETFIPQGATLLFQGDSITDARRDRKSASKPNEQSALGGGYAAMAASQLLVGWPQQELQIFNRGISGNKVFQLADRWEKDCFELKPDVLSILIGVNDVWHKRNGKYDGTIETYRKDYRALLERTKERLPEIRLVICEPFLLQCGVIDETWWPEFNPFREAAKELAQQFDAKFVPFQTMFDEAVKYAPAEYWAQDGVHPTPFGAQLMAGEWMRTVMS